MALFETMRVHKKKIIRLDEHLERLERGAKKLSLKIPCTKNQLKQIIQKKAQAVPYQDVYLKVILWRTPLRTILSFIVKKYQPHPVKIFRRGFSGRIGRWKIQQGHILSEVKSTQRLFYEVKFNAAKSRGFDEALIENSAGYLTEASRSNIFWVKDNTLFTPALACGCLPGITRGLVLDLARQKKIKAREGEFRAVDLYSADEAFLTNSLMGIMPLTKVNRCKIGNGKPGKITCQLIKKYNCLLK